MKANEILTEDGWWTDKIKKGALKVGAKFSSKKQGQLNARNRATGLVTKYKEALGSGLPATALDMRKWLASGNNPVDPALMKDAAKRSGLNLRTNTELSMSQARDFLVALAGAEANLGQQGGAGVGAAAQPTKSSGQPGGDAEPITMDNLAAALKALKADDGRYVRDG